MFLVKGSAGRALPLKVKYQGAKSPTAKERIQKFLSQVDEVHELPKDQILVHFVPTKKLKAEGVKAKFDSDGKIFYVDPKGTSFHHEFGHFMDRFVLGDADGKPWSEANSNYRRQFGFKKKPRKTKGLVQYYDPIRGVKGWFTPRREDDFSATTGHYARSQPKEHFASAYNKAIGKEVDGSTHHIPDQEMGKFKKILYRQLQRANLEIKKEMKDLEVIN